MVLSEVSIHRIDDSDNSSFHFKLILLLWLLSKGANGSPFDGKKTLVLVLVGKFTRTKQSTIFFGGWISFRFVILEVLSGSRVPMGRVQV